MRRLTSLVISLPLLATPLIFSGVSPVNAKEQNVGPIGAVRLLAQSGAADSKCHHLTSREHLELKDYLAKAEIAAATMASAPLAQDARRSGNKRGKSAVCGRGSEELVRATLDAARRAMAQAIAQRQPRQVVRQQPRNKTVETSISDQRPIVNATSLTRYRRVTEAYYLERRCQHLSRSKAVRFWKRIVSSHNAVLRKYSALQVSKAKTGAERAARDRGSCGARTARIVKAGYGG